MTSNERSPSSAVAAVGIDQVRLSYDYLDRGDLDGYVSLLDARAVLRRPSEPPLRGRAEVERCGGSQLVGHHTLEHVFAGGGRVAAVGHFAGVNSCLVIVADTSELFEAFSAGMRSVHGKLLISGIPRMTRPRLRNDRYTGFTVVDPGGNWIRINKAAKEPEALTRLAKAMENAARQADGRGDERQGLKILEGALKRATGDEPEFPAAREYRDELVERISS